MTNPLYLMAGLLLTLAYPTSYEPLGFASPSWGLPAVAVAVVAYGALAAGLLRALRRHPIVARIALRWIALLVYAVLLFVFHFPLWVWSLGLEESLVLGPLVTLLPLLALFAVLAVLAARADPVRRRVLRDTLTFAFRSFVAFSFIPVVLLLGIDAGLERIRWLRRAAFLVPAVGWGAAFLGLLGLVSLLPFLLRLAYGARALPPGPLRARLEAICRATGFRCRDLLVIRTGGTQLANAFIVGPAPALRFVFFTDAILEGMTPEHLECVLAHEIAHSRLRHLQSFLVAIIGFGFINAAGYEALEGAGLPAGLAALALAAWAVFFWVGLFGFVSRRFESEADLAAAEWAPAGARGMAEALDRVADLNRIPPAAWGWRHFSIERRISILWEASEKPALGIAFRAGCARFRWGAGAFFLVGTLLVGMLAFRQISRAPERESLYLAYGRAEQGMELLRAGRYREARSEFQAAIAGGADGSQEWLWIAKCERGLGEESEARKAETEAIKKRITDPRERRRLGQ
jgi:Zn-dependent protease with chaperone function